MPLKPNLPDFEALLKRKKSAKKPVRESVVEAAHMQAVKADGGISFKFVSPSRRSVPDRLDLRPIPEAVRELVAKYVRFTECKRPGEVPTPSQHREHERLRELGFTVDVVNSLPTKEPK
jgi:hypothetical protein